MLSGDISNAFGRLHLTSNVLCAFALAGGSSTCLLRFCILRPLYQSINAWPRNLDFRHSLDGFNANRDNRGRIVFSFKPDVIRWTCLIPELGKSAVSQSTELLATPRPVGRSIPLDFDLTARLVRSEHS